MKKHHPEQGDDEIYFSNCSNEGFKQMGWKTKRQGEKVLNRDGSPMPQSTAYHYRPVFVKRAEIEDALKNTSDGFVKKCFQKMLRQGVSR